MEQRIALVTCAKKCPLVSFDPLRKNSLFLVYWAKLKVSIKLRKISHITHEVLKKIDLYKTAAKVMGHFLNTSWTGA